MPVLCRVAKVPLIALFGLLVFAANRGAGAAPPTLTTLFSFDGTNGKEPEGLIIDAAGNLFRTTSVGGNANGNCSHLGCGTVFELTPQLSGSWTETVLYRFCSQSNCADGASPRAGLIADAAGNLFGTTAGGGAHGYGAVFEIAETGTGYASTPITLVSFTGGSDGEGPQAGLIADAAGDLFGTTNTSGVEAGTVFELVKAAGGYALTTLLGFNGNNGANLQAGLIVDAAENLFGTTSLAGPNGSRGHGVRDS